MSDDHYATLGVDPRADAGTIRAAYLALMRHYHPDRNDCPAATERARAVIAAFAVLGDAEKRLHYDWGRRRAADAAVADPPRWYEGKEQQLVFAGSCALLLLALTPLLLTASPSEVRKPRAAPTAAVASLESVRSTRPKKIIVQPTFPPPLAPPEPNPMLEPVPAEPPPVEVRQRTVEVTSDPKVATRLASPPRRPLGKPLNVASGTANAATNEKCRSVKPGAERAICTNDNLVALDRSVVDFYNQSLKFGAATKRGALLDSRTRFLVRRDLCRSDQCLQHLHLAHLRELTAIIANKPPAPTP